MARMQCKNVDRRLDDVELPLKNIEFTIQQYLMAHGARLDTETRLLLAGVRDCVGRIAVSPGAQDDQPSTQVGTPELLAG